MISSKALEDFKAIWFEEFGNEISDELAIGEAVNLLTMFDAVYRPLKKGWVSDSDTEIDTPEVP
jgi:hypothetical protein